ncbi:hypothetical protein [Ectobacillus ponti]|uniref:Uncharacterized protein n=1 Tax=Ectobacillus ponti TaxID=2961894 RepID=A0AA42BP72_9BACI|nr:hypothetical protein [Ectobacillus ponti]MCP8968111.1 hypothetical protein [Ectobacillus ponti]
MDTCLGNHAGAPYATCFLPPAPGQHPSEGQEPPVGYNPDDPDNKPANINFVGPGFTYKLRPDEAIVFVGKTPPPAVYFAFRSYLGFIENKPGKDYSGTETAGTAETGFYHSVLASLGDQLNNFNIRTAGGPFDSSTVIISTADQGINQQIRDALAEAGFDPSIMNNDNIPAGLVNMGLEKGRDTFLFLMRAALWTDPAAGQQYLSNLSQYIKVYRITPKTLQTDLNPWPIPNLTIKETGSMEFQAIPYARQELDYLRSRILSKYGGKNFHYTDLNFNLAILENFEAILNDVNVWADNRDALYLQSDLFQFTSDDDFLILYGVNHKQTGKATFSNASFYGNELFNGVAVANITGFQNSAAAFFPEGYENEKLYYVCKMARKAAGEGIEILVPYSMGNPNGKAYGVDNNQDASIIFRLYVDPRTLTGPAPFDVIWDRAILFTKNNPERAACKDIIVKVAGMEIRL